MSTSKKATSSSRQGAPAGTTTPGAGTSKKDLVLVGLISNPTEADCQALATALCDAFNKQ
jgi:hypothetical protein